MKICNLFCSNFNNINRIKNVSAPDFSFKGIRREEPDTDRFERSSDYTGDMSFKAFETWAETNGFASKCSDIVDYSGKILGSGFEGTVYEIPDCGNWVIKSFKRSNFMAVSLEHPVIKEIEDIIPGKNVGQSIAVVQIPCGKDYSRQYWILKKQQGTPLDILSDYNPSDREFFNDYRVKKHIDSLKLLADLPQSTYNKFIKDIKYINSCGYKLDYDNGGNFLYDEENKTINFVDVNDKFGINDDKNQYADILFTLLNGKFGLDYIDKSEENKDKVFALQASKTILDKYGTAMKNNNVKFKDCDKLRMILRCLSKNGGNSKVSPDIDKIIEN